MNCREFARIMGEYVNRTLCAEVAERAHADELRDVATSLRLITGRPADREDLLGRLCRTLDSWYNSLIRGEREQIIRGYEGLMAFSPGTRVRVTTVRGETGGEYRGLTPGGRLRLHGPGGPESFSFEEIQALDWE